MIKFTVYGQPQPGGSKRHVSSRTKAGTTVHRVIDDNPQARPWKALVADAAIGARNSAGLLRERLLDGPLRVVFVFYRPRPRGQFRKNGELNAEGRRSPAPTTKPDVLKLSRSTEDALTGLVWRDDSQIVDEVIAKRWGEPARVEILIEELTETALLELSLGQDGRDGRNT